MGCLGSKDRLTKEDMEFLKSHTRYDEVTIKEWYKGFKVSTNIDIFSQIRQVSSIFRNNMTILDTFYRTFFEIYRIFFCSILKKCLTTLDSSIFHSIVLGSFPVLSFSFSGAFSFSENLNLSQK